MLDEKEKELLNKDTDVLVEIKTRMYTILSIIASHIEDGEFDEALVLLVSLLSFITFLLCVKNDHHDNVSDYMNMVISLYGNLLNALVEDARQGHLQIN